MLLSQRVQLDSQGWGGGRHIDSKGSRLGGLEDFAVNFLYVFWKTNDRENEVGILYRFGNSLGHPGSFFS